MKHQARKDETLRFHKGQLLRVLAYIREHLDGPIELEAMASLACLSPFHFHRVFRGMTGEALMAHVRRLRLERAARQLRASSRPVIDVALEAGFDSHEAFTRAFKAAYVFSPTAFRRRSGPSPSLYAPSGVHYRPGVPLTDFRTQNKGLGSMKVKIVHLPPIRVAFLRHVGPYNECGLTWDRLCTWLGKEGLLGMGVRFIGVGYDDPECTPPEKVRYDACVEVGADFEPADGIGVQYIEGGDYACATHVGPYEQLSDVYTVLMGQWIPNQQRSLRNVPCFEIYLNTPENTAPEDLVTDVHVPLAPRSATP